MAVVPPNLTLRSPGSSQTHIDVGGRSMELLLEGRTAVITGAGSGVGRASAVYFGSEGANVVVADVMEEWAKQTVRLVEEAGGSATVAVCDVTDEGAVEAAIRAAVDTYGRLDVVFNNAGISTPPDQGSFDETSAAQWDKLMDINLRGVFHGMKHGIRQFKAQGAGGAIVNTASVAGMVGWGGAIYGVTKGAVIQMTRAVAIEVAPLKIRVNAVCPAALPLTNFTTHDPDHAFQEKPESVLEMVAGFQPLGQVITAEDVAYAAGFLASDRARNITGVALPIDGGYTAR